MAMTLRSPAQTLRTMSAFRSPSGEERTEERRQELVSAVKEAAEIVEEGLGVTPKHAPYQTIAYSLILRELLDYE